MSASNRSLGCAALLATVFCLAAGPAEATTLRWQFTSGQTFKQTIVQDMKTSVQVGGQNIQTLVVQTIDAEWEVGEVGADGAAQVTQRIKRIRMKMDGAGGLSAEIDTASDEQPQGVAALLAAPLKAFAKATFQMKMSPLGEILEVEISEETIKALQSMPGANQMGGMFTKEGLVNMVKQGTPTLPQEDVEPGDSWSNKLEIKMPQLGTMETVNTLTYRGPAEADGQSLQRIDMEIKQSVAASDNPLVKISIKEQKSEGQMLFNNQQGHLTQSELVQQMVMQLTAGGNTFDQTIEQTIKVNMEPIQ